MALSPGLSRSGQLCLKHSHAVCANHKRARLECDSSWRQLLSWPASTALNDLSQADLNEAEAADAYACLSLEG